MKKEIYFYNNKTKNIETAEAEVVFKGKYATYKTPKGDFTMLKFYTRDVVYPKSEWNSYQLFTDRKKAEDWLIKKMETAENKKFGY